MCYTSTLYKHELDPCARTSEERLLEWGVYIDGDKVWVRPTNILCGKLYEAGMVIRMLSDLAVEISGIPHHVRDLCPCGDAGDLDSTMEDDKDGELLMCLVGLEEVLLCDGDSRGSVKCVALFFISYIRT